ncbi:MOP flippase family protein [Acetomicrobium sp.]|uniref:MOP flippase family protein n=1 Tax=Acetomicrobium sp. TaxID=1872099 RepID=UPI002870B6F9|nr:MOP flippase family protein [Acetomicrobium sp.]MDR9768945.1 MOP flippase family protein [Acetomicrobium sp.]
MMKLDNIFKSSNTNFKTPSQGLYQRTVRSGVWALAMRVFERGLGIVKLIILARMLAPNDFGLMGIALLAMACLETFSQTGFQQALIQKKEMTEEYLDVAWTFMLIRNIVLFILLFIAAPYIASFFAAPRVTSIVRVIGASLLLGGIGGIGGFANIGVLCFQRELEFNKQFFYRLTGALADFIISIGAAVVLKSVWALVIGLLTGNIVKLFVGYMVHPYRPRLNFDLNKARELFGFGKWILASSILVFLVTQGDDIFVGKLLGATILGFYQIAYKLSNAPATEITHVISQVAFPAYSKLQDNTESLGNAYLKTLQLVAFVSIPLAGGIFVLAPDFVHIFLGEKWVSIVSVMQILALAGLVRSIQATTGPLFQAIGKPKIDTQWQVIRLLVLAISVYPLTVLWGVLGTAIAVLVSIFTTFLGCSMMVIKVTGCDIKSYNKAVACPLVAGIIMVFFIVALKNILSSSVIYTFFFFVIIGGFVYLAVIYILSKLFRYNIGTFVRNCWTSLRNN